MKRCSKCGLDKDEKEFYTTTKGKMRSACKACTKIQTDAYRKTHLEIYRQARRRWRSENPEKQREACRVWVERNREYWNAVCREYDAQHPEQRREYIKNNPLRKKWYQAKSNAKKKGKTFTLTLEQFVLLFDNAKCFYCGNEPSGLDRVDNSRGYEINNVVPCCWACNTIKGNLGIAELRDHLKKMVETLNTVLDGRHPEAKMDGGVGET